jgi:hypothetical protein
MIPNWMRANQRKGKMACSKPGAVEKISNQNEDWQV